MNLLFAHLLLATATVQEVPLGKMVEGLQCHTDPSQTYTLYLPSGYTPERHWPAMLIFDPRKRSRLAADLFREAAEESYSGTTARRVLEAIYVRMGYYLTRDFLAAREYRKLVTVLDVASAIKEDNPEVAYNLACAHALLGKKRPALAALERAVDLGYSNVDHMRSDPDLESLRDDERFQTLLTRLTHP